MNIVGLMPNSGEWLAMREEKIGASDCNIIMGLSDFMTPFQLWQQKLKLVKRDDDKNTFIQDKGHRVEAKMRNLIELKKGADFKAIIVVCDMPDFLMASLDGYSSDLHEIWECKYVGQEDFKIVQSGKMLDHYIPQVQMQLYLTGANLCNFSVFADDKESDLKFKECTIEVKADLKYIKDSLIPKVIEFRQFVVNKVAPPLTKKDTVDMSSNTSFFNLLKKLEDKDKVLTALEKEVKQIKEEIFTTAKKVHNRIICNGIKVSETISDPEEVIDYEAYCTFLKLVIPKEFKKKPNGRKTQRITFPKIEAPESSL